MSLSRTHALTDGRHIEAAADRRGDILRLHARLCENDIVVVAHRRDFDLSTWDVIAAAEEFTGEFAGIAGIFVDSAIWRDV